jgi:hypothetical protein
MSRASQNVQPPFTICKSLEIGWDDSARAAPANASIAVGKPT